jgi:hypothetical protein
MWRSIVLGVCLAGSTAHAQEAETKLPEIKDYEISVNVDTTALKMGDAGRCSFTIHPRLPWTLKSNTPFEGTVTATSGLELLKAKLTSKDFADLKPADKTLVIPFNVHELGLQRVTTDVSFFLCTEQVCQRYKETVECKY